MAEVVILGAGLTGLSAAYHLEQQGFFDYKIYEKEDTVGGLCRSVKQDGFTFDFTGHLLHISDPEFRKFIETVIGLEHFNVIKRQSFIYSQDRYTRYPYQVNLFGLPPETIAECIEGFVTRRTTHKQPRSFHDWVLNNFGAGFGKHFFFPYQTKIFDYDIHQLSASWTGRFVPSTSLTSMIRGAITDVQDDIGYNANFLYPHKGGIYFWIDKLYRQLMNPVYKSHTVTRIDMTARTITFANGTQESYKQLITTLPLDILLKLIQEPSSSSLKRAQTKLLCNSVVNFNLGVSHEHLSDKHWIYFPENIYPFYRIGFTHNFAESMAPPGMSSLYGEFSHLNRPQTEIDQLLVQSLEATKKLLQIRDSDIATEKIISIKHAYVIYNAWRDKHVPIILDKLQEKSIFSTGRYGAWKYASMQEGFLDGKTAADTIMSSVIPVMPGYRTYGQAKTS